MGAGMGGEMDERKRKQVVEEPKQSTARQDERQGNGTGRAGRKGKPTKKATDQGMKANVQEVIDSLLTEMAHGSRGSAELLNGLAEGKFAMEEIGSESEIQSLAMMLTAAPQWDEKQDAEQEEFAPEQERT